MQVIFKSEVFPQWNRMGELTVQSWNNLNDDSACPLPHLQVVFRVKGHIIHVSLVIGLA